MTWKSIKGGEERKSVNLFGGRGRQWNGKWHQSDYLFSDSVSQWGNSHRLTCLPAHMLFLPWPCSCMLVLCPWQHKHGLEVSLLSSHPLTCSYLTHACFSSYSLISFSTPLTCIWGQAVGAVTGCWFGIWAGWGKAGRGLGRLVRRLASPATLPLPVEGSAEKAGQWATWGGLNVKLSGRMDQSSLSGEWGSGLYNQWGTFQTVALLHCVSLLALSCFSPHTFPSLPTTWYSILYQILWLCSGVWKWH